MPYMVKAWGNVCFAMTTFTKNNSRNEYRCQFGIYGYLIFSNYLFKPVIQAHTFEKHLPEMIILSIQDQICYNKINLLSRQQIVMIRNV